MVWVVSQKTEIKWFCKLFQPVNEEEFYKERESKKLWLNGLKNEPS